MDGKVRKACETLYKAVTQNRKHLARIAIEPFPGPALSFPMHSPRDECARARRWVPCCLEPQRVGGEWADCPNGAFPIPAGSGKGWRRGNSELLPALAQALSLESASDIWVFSDGLSHLPNQVRHANPIYGACIPLCRTNAGSFMFHSWRIRRLTPIVLRPRSLSA